MNEIGKPERVTQNRVKKLFKEELDYDYLGNFEYRDNNSNIEEAELAKYLKSSSYSETQINRAIHLLKNEATNSNRSLYENNKIVYEMLRYGVAVKAEAGQNNETVQLINWSEPQKNNFAIAEEVTIKGNHEKRPDVVLYINGIAIAVLELKRSTKSIGDGIRQNIANQQETFIEGFFTTIQLVFAGNDTEGLRYGTIKTPEKYFLTWKEDEEENDRYKLDKYLLKMCSKERLIDLIYNFILFDAGIKKVPRVHQYFATKEAQKHVKSYEGGIIWHTQGSGKSIVMVLLAKWILENNPNSRVVVITDRDELDKQIKDVFVAAGETIYRTSSGRDLMSKLSEAKPRLLCSLVHKFGRKDVDNFEDFIQELESQPCQTQGEIFVFVDECHRTQSGKLHTIMKTILANSVFIGFTGTPLLKKDVKTTMEIFGRYIHTYKFNEAVEDKVILDLVYEARDIDQRLGSEEKVNSWFEEKTAALNDWQKAVLKEEWGTMQKVLSSKSRMEKIVQDIVFDFATRKSLKSEKGNAILVASSIFEACKYYRLLQNTSFKNRCAIVTSYNPAVKDINQEDTGANTETDKEFIYEVYTEILENIQPRPNQSKTETYEEIAKDKFKKEPANMKLLVVVDKLLTGFDAPSCTYLYLDKKMQDHGLFQAICRVNRLNGDEKMFGYIVDYKDLFKKVENAIKVYTSPVEEGEADKTTSEILLKDRLKAGKDALDNALEKLELLCEPVEAPKHELDYIHYFCGNTEIEEELKKKEAQRASLYKGVASFVRAFVNIADELQKAGYTLPEIERLTGKLEFYKNLREVIKNASGEVLDLKPYEADMRFMIDNYIEAEQAKTISPFGDMSLLEIVVKTGIAAAISNLPEGIKGSNEAVAETIENNVRSKIIKDHLNDPAFYEQMSKLLDEIIKLRKKKAIEYSEYLKKIAEIAQKVQSGVGDDTPAELNTKGLRAIYNFLAALEKNNAVKEEASAFDGIKDKSVEFAQKIDKTIKHVRSDNWRGHLAKEQQIKAALFGIFQSEEMVEKIFPLIKENQEY